MRLDKYLKVSRIIKRRTVAKEAAEASLIYVNDRLAKPSTTLKEGDTLTLHFSQKILSVRVLSTTLPKVGNDTSMYELISETKKS